MGGDVYLDMEIRAFLQAAQPSWKRSQVNLAKNKLERVGIGSVTELLNILERTDGPGLNELFVAHDEKVFGEDTLVALQVQSKKPLPVPQMPNLEDGSQEFGQADQRLSLESTPVDEKPRRFAPPMRFQPQAQQQEDVRSPSAGGLDAKLASAPADSHPIDEELETRIRALKGSGLTDEAARGLARKQLAVEKERNARFQQSHRPKAKPTMTRVIEDNARPAVALPPPPQLSGDHVWFSVKFKQVFVKKAPNEKAKSWGFVFSGQKIQASPNIVPDDSGRPWAELTLFELWRSCLRKDQAQPYHSLSKDESRAFCLIDGSDMKLRKTDITLGKLLEGPLPSSACPDISSSELYAFQNWVSMKPEAGSSVPQKTAKRTETALESEIEAYKTEIVRLQTLGKQQDHAINDMTGTGESLQAAEESWPASSSSMPPMASKSAQKFQILHDLVIHERPHLEARVLGRKTAGELVYAHEEVVNGWVQLAGEPGWVLLDARMDPEEEIEQKRLQAMKDNITAVVKTFQMQRLGGQGQDATVDARITLRKQLAQCEADPEASLVELEFALKRAQAFGVDQDVLETAEAKVWQLQQEGPLGRMARHKRGLLENAKSAEEIRAVIRDCKERGVLEVVEEAQIMLEHFLADQESAKMTHDAVLDYLVAAIATGDPAAIKEARNTAKAAGVPKKELARAFALAQDVAPQ